MKFDPSAAQKRVEKCWGLDAKFGGERSAYYIYLNEIVSDRYTLVNGLQLLRDELQFASTLVDSDIIACGADLSLPSVVTTVAHTNCGDRIHQGEATTSYVHTVAARFGTMSEIGELKLEAFSPTGGGTDDGATLAHVTVAHQLDEEMRQKIYAGNAQSYILVNIDLKTHVGRHDDGGKTTFGTTQEAPWRVSRAACGAVVGTLAKYNPENYVHRRIRKDLGEANFDFLSKNRVLADDGTDVTAAVASSIVAIQGLKNTAAALEVELDERGVGHLTASMTVNRVSMDDTVIYLARATVFNGETRIQGLGTDATKYSARIEKHGTDTRVILAYDGEAKCEYPIASTSYQIRQGKAAATKAIDLLPTGPSGGAGPDGSAPLPGPLRLRGSGAPNRLKPYCERRFARACRRPRRLRSSNYRQ